MTLPDATERDGATTLPIGGADEASPSPYAAGDVVADKYQLLKILGEGGMGSVWLARNQMLHVDVALKLIRAELASAHTKERLVREARATARLKHPSIVRVHDFGESERGDPFIVMEVLEGESLDEVLDRTGTLPATRAVQLILPIVSALAEAHEHGVVHRDIKPENIILVTDRQGTLVPKILDFGIAKVGRAGVVSGEIPNDPQALASHEVQRRLTNLGTLVGSPDYMSPEQGRGDSTVDERADIWAVCVVLYEMVAGRRPFDGQEVKDVLLSLMMEDPQPLTAFGSDPALWEIVAKGLEKLRDDRWQDARELGESLARWLLEAGVETDVAGTALRAHWFTDDPVTGRTSLASLHLDPLSVSVSQSELSLSDARPAVAKEDTNLRRALYVVIGVTMVLLGMGIALLVIEPGREASVQDVTAAPRGQVEPATPTLEGTAAPEVPSDHADGVVDEGQAAGEGGTAAIGAAQMASATTSVSPPSTTVTGGSKTVAPRPKKPAPSTAKGALPLPPDKPDF